MCGPHRQMVQQLLAGPLKRLRDGTAVVKLNPLRLCRRIREVQEGQQLVSDCTWEAEATEALVTAVRQLGYLGWDAVKKQLEGQGVWRTAQQCQLRWREVQCKGGQVRLLENASLGERWKGRDAAIEAEMDCQEAEELVDLGSSLILWCPLLACYLRPVSDQLAQPPATLLPQMIQEDFMVGLSAFFRTPLIDRTGILNKERHGFWGRTLDRNRSKSLEIVLEDCCLRLSALDPLPEPDPAFTKDLATAPRLHFGHVPHLN